MLNPSENKAELVLNMYESELNKATSAKISAQEYNGMPTGSAKGNPTEDSYVKGISAQVYCDKVLASINLLSNEDYSKMIKHRFIDKDTAVKIYSQIINKSERTYYYWLPKALIQFAEICPDDVYDEAVRESEKKNKIKQLQ